MTSWRSSVRHRAVTIPTGKMPRISGDFTSRRSHIAEVRTRTSTTTPESGGGSMTDSPMDDFLEELRKAPGSDYPDWEDAADLGRLHLQAFIRSHGGHPEVNRSSGQLRLSGKAVRGHSLAMEDAAMVL